MMIRIQPNSKEVKKSPSTVSLYLSQIVEDELVEIKIVEQKAILY